jgi:hypothetical protein
LKLGMKMQADNNRPHPLSTPKQYPLSTHGCK